ncbi:MAG: EAL domain-containing protein, partial [Bacilli bacterium]
CASTALQRAKESQLSKYMVYDSEFGNVLSRAQIMEQDLIISIQKKQFVMFYQPQYDSSKKKIIGLEALIRWNNPKYRNENPENYIKMAEKNGAIVELGRLIIDESFKFAKTIEDTGIHISINVSPAQLLHSGFVNEVLNLFKQYQLKKNSIAIEITETFLMENSEVVIAKIKILREAGFEIHLDDFGTGYSSILYLKDLPIDVIKIDKEFTNKFLIDKYSRVITTKIAQMAFGLDLKTIVEGVTTEKQMKAFAKIGCNVIQGYYISKPVDNIKIVELIKEINGEEGLTKKVKKTVSVKVEDTFTPEEISKNLEKEKNKSKEIDSKEKNNDISS